MWRRRDWIEPRPSVAENIGMEKELFRPRRPAAGLHPDVIEQLWTREFERQILPAIDAAKRRAESSWQREVLLDHVAAAGVRHPGFGEAVNRWRADLGMSAVTGDPLQAERLSLLAAGCRWFASFGGVLCTRFRVRRASR
jgi:hypothetical protein